MPNRPILSRRNLYTYTKYLFVIYLSISSVSQAEEKPLWELGIGIGALHQPYYVGTKDTRTYAFPAPLPVYRGNIFRSDEKGMRAQLIEEDRYELEMSLDFNLKIDSDDVDLREGMDDVDTMLQIGPSLEVTLAETEKTKWELNLPVRASFAIDSHGVDGSGYNFSPNITYYRQLQWGKTPWRAGVALGPQFATHKYQNVYYGVDDEFATADRPAYRADSGYAGSRLLLTMRSRNEDRLWVWFVRYENIDGAEFDDSPLVETNHGTSVGFIYSRFIFKSNQTVNR